MILKNFIKIKKHKFKKVKMKKIYKFNKVTLIIMIFMGKFFNAKMLPSNFNCIQYWNLRGTNFVVEII